MPADGLMAGRTNEVLERVYIFQYKVEKWMATFFFLFFYTVTPHSLPTLPLLWNSTDFHRTWEGE